MLSVTNGQSPAAGQVFKTEQSPGYLVLTE